MSTLKLKKLTDRKPKEKQKRNNVKNLNESYLFTYYPIKFGRKLKKINQKQITNSSRDRDR